MHRGWLVQPATTWPGAQQARATRRRRSGGEPDPAPGRAERPAPGTEAGKAQEPAHQQGCAEHYPPGRSSEPQWTVEKLGTCSFGADGRRWSRLRLPSRESGGAGGTGTGSPMWDSASRWHCLCGRSCMGARARRTLRQTGLPRRGGLVGRSLHEGSGETRLPGGVRGWPRLRRGEWVMGRGPTPAGLPIRLRALRGQEGIESPAATPAGARARWVTGNTKRGPYLGPKEMECTIRRRNRPGRALSAVVGGRTC